MHALRSQGWINLAGLMALLVVGGCAGPNLHKAPVEERGTSRTQSTTSLLPATPETMPVKPLPGAENAGKPGYYMVKAGDTLIRIGLDNGQSWKDISRWNMLDNPNLIEVGQVLRVISPNAVATENGVMTRPVSSSTVSAVSVPAPTSISAASAASAASNPASAVSAAT